MSTKTKMIILGTALSTVGIMAYKKKNPMAFKKAKNMMRSAALKVATSLDEME